MNYTLSNVYVLLRNYNMVIIMLLIILPRLKIIISNLLQNLHSNN